MLGFTGVVRSCEEVWQKVCQELPGVVRSCQDIPGVASICQGLPGVVMSFQDDP